MSTPFVKFSWIGRADSVGEFPVAGDDGRPGKKREGLVTKRKSPIYALIERAFK